jgi:hypothetical protein
MGFVDLMQYYISPFHSTLELNSHVASPYIYFKGFRFIPGAVKRSVKYERGLAKCI